MFVIGVDFLLLYAWLWVEGIVSKPPFHALPADFLMIGHVDAAVQALHLSNNGLKSLPCMLFATCIQLSTLDLHNTEITVDVLRQVRTHPLLLPSSGSMSGIVSIS